MKISKYALKFSYSLKPYLYQYFFNFSNIYFKYPITIKAINSQILVSDKYTDYKVFNSRPQRLLRYSNGIKHLCDSILLSYHLTELVFPDNAVIVDIGANVGEVSYALLRKNLTLQIIGIEPDPKDFQDLKNNVISSSSVLINSAVAEFSGSIQMFLNNDFGDTSAFDTENSVGTMISSCASLDDIYSKYINSKNIFLVKCEAEGLEPEVLLGGKLALSNTIYVCCDTGPERAGEYTFEQTHKILTDLNFRLLKGNRSRSLYLNNAYQTASDLRL
jgi:FkbM family methyltransferase